MTKILNKELLDYAKKAGVSLSEIAGEYHMDVGCLRDQLNKFELQEIHVLSFKDTVNRLVKDKSLK